MLHVLLCLLLLLLSPTAFAAVGTVETQIGVPASIDRSNNTLEGKKGTGVEMNDEIRTVRGKLGIIFADNTTVQINENSKLVIDDFVYDPKAKTGKLSMKVALGTVRYASGQIAHNNNQNVNIKTPTATIAVRGTDFTATVDEIGVSTVILLPTCPAFWIDVSRDCYTGVIDVITEGGMVTLTKPFEATKVYDSSLKPMKPVILNLNPDAINNMLIVSPPKEILKQEEQTKVEAKGALDQNFLKEEVLTNALDEQANNQYVDKLSRNLLDQDFLGNILDIVNAQLAADLDMLNNTASGLLPDYKASTGVVVEIDEPSLTLFRDDGSSRQSVNVPTSQSSTIYMIQGSVEIMNRVNSAGTTTITLKQN
jgi:hypothetical protein